MIWSNFLNVTKNWHERPAVVTDDGTLSYGELIERVHTTAQALPPAQGCTPDRVLVVETDPLPLLLKILACWCDVRVPVILREGRNAVSAEDIATYIFTATDAATVGSNPEVAASQPPVTSDPRAEALVICTSGTTQMPKLVALPASSVLTNARQIGHSCGFQQGDLVAVATPLTYMFGLMGASLSALWAGATIRLFPTTAPPTVIQSAIRNEGVTVVQGPPSLLRLFLAYWSGTPFPSVRLVTTGGELVDDDLPVRLYEAFPACELQKIYGMTEAGPRISHRRLERHSQPDTSVGKPFAHLEWHVAPLPDRARDQRLPPGTGRLAVRGPTMFLGYITKDGGYAGLEPDGYFISNDMVFVDTSGEMHFVDRMDRMFKSGGKLVSPTEVETVLLQHPSVKEARCKKEAHPLLGFVPVVDIVQHADQTATPQELSEHCELSLQKHAVPRRFDDRETIPLAPSGKRM